MIRIKLLLSLALLAITSFSWSQQYYNQQENFLKANRVWVFGNKAGLDFNSGRPVPIQTGAESLEGTAAAADPTTGALLFYVARGGEQVWTRNHQKMPNGDSVGGHTSTTQTCIVPVIDSPGIYYVFTLAGNETYASYTGLRYSVVDMSLNGGLGDVRPGQKGIVLIPELMSEALTAIPGNNCDIWLITHRQKKPEFIAFHITKSGIDLNPVLSAPPGPDTSLVYLGGQGMFFSSDRERIYITALKIPDGKTRQYLLYKFDPNTGKVYDPLILDHPKSAATSSMTSAAFSPDNSKLYLNNDSLLLQFDISTYNTTAINASMYIVTKDTRRLLPISGFRNMCGLRLYGDTIYVGSGMGVDRQYLSTISRPNLSGAACGYDSASILLLPGTYSAYGIGSEIVYPLTGNKPRTLALDTLICSDQFNLGLKATSGYNYYSWQDGYVGGQRQVSNPGTYWVKASMVGGEEDPDCNYSVDTFIIRGGNFPSPVITVNVFELSTTAVYDTYQWYFNGGKIPGATQQKLQVNQNGNYTVEVSSLEGCAALSDIYKVTNVTGIPDDLNPELYNQVYPNPTQDVLYIKSSAKLNAVVCSLDGKVLLEVNNATMIPMKSLATGMYILKVKDQYGRIQQSIKVIKY